VNTTFGVGVHNLSAVYNGVAAFAASTSPTVSQTVNNSSTTTVLTSSLNPSFISQTVTFTASVSGQFGGTPTGSITFKQGTKALSTVALGNGQANYTTSYTTAGNRAITAVYSGDGNYVASTSAVLTQVVKKVSSTTTLTSSQNPSNAGQAVTFTATVVSGNPSLSLPAPTGTVQFKDGSTLLGSSSLSGGVATLTTTALSTGTHSITAVYGGNVDYAGSTSPKLSQVVSGLPTTTSVVSSLNPSTYGQSITFTATVTPTSGTGVPTGTITFKSGTSTLAKVAMSSGSASYTTAALGAGTKSITAVYSGDTTYATSTSPALSQVVYKASTTTALSSSANPSTAGQSVTFTATVSPQYGGAVTGTVTFKLGSTTLATVPTSGGVASYTTSSLPSGSDVITATYNGSTNLAKSSTSITQTVN
jgi:hypothetical protein